MKFPFSATLFVVLSLPAGAAVNFRTQVLPLLSKSCMECHRAPHKDPKTGKMTEPKGRLRLDGAGGIMKGGEEGDAVVAGDPDKSSIYQRILLPASHEDVMPPKGKAPMITFEQSEIIKEWIIEGADFGDWKGAEDGAGTAVAKKSSRSTDPNAAGVTMAPEAAKQKIIELGALVGPVTSDSPLLRVEWVSGAGQITDKEIALLPALAANISELDLSDTKITDESLAIIGKFPRLTWLNLNNTAITDAGIAHLKGLSNLAYLNLHSTNVSDTSLTSLAPLRKLRQVYVWKTRVTPAAAAKFAKSIPDVMITLE